MMTHELPSQKRRFWTVASDQVDVDLLVFFRIAFAVVGLSWVVKQYASGAIEHFYTGPRFYFHYYGFHWVPSLPEGWAKAEFLIMGIAAVCVGCGAFYRVASLLFAIGFTHLFLSDKCLYQNHYYLICLISWLMVIVPANRAFSLDAMFRPTIRSQSVPRWAIWLLRFQIGVPYFFGGIAKINSDWLAGEPMRSMLSQRANFPMVGQYFNEEWCAYLFAYGGLIFDLLVVPALLTKRFRVFACLAAVGFHLTNSWLFTIGVFPWFMLLALPIFFDPGCIRKRFARPMEELVATTAPSSSNISRPFAFALAIFVMWQTLFPLRHLAIPGNPSWTEEGHYFAWHMLIRGKRGALRYLATDRRTGNTGAIDLRRYVTEFQLSRLSRDPRMIHELSHYIASDLRSLGFEVELRALALVSMNGRKPQLLVDRDVDLVKEQIDWRKPEWIVPLKEPLRDVPWGKPLSEWEALLNQNPQSSVSE